MTTLSRTAARTCLDCPAPISRKSKGRCRSCAARVKNRSADMRAAVSAAQRRSWATPERRAGVGNNLKAWRATREGQLKLAQMNRERGRRRSEALHAWCPPGWLKRYKALRSTYGVEEGRRRVRAEIAAAEHARRAAMSPFERQMEALKRGAGLVDKFVPRTAHAFTLGGVVGEMV